MKDIIPNVPPSALRTASAISASVFIYMNSAVITESAAQTAPCKNRGLEKKELCAEPVFFAGLAAAFVFDFAPVFFLSAIYVHIPPL